MNRPETKEFAPYYNTYISLIDSDNVLPVLEAQPAEVRALFSDVPEEKGTFAYEPGKWTIKEMLSHLIDGERMFAYRILRICSGVRICCFSTIFPTKLRVEWVPRAIK